MKNKIYKYSFLALTLIYIGLVLGLPSDPEVLDRYNLTESSLRFIGLTVAIPLLAVWISAAYAYLRFDEYTQIVADEPEGKPFKHLTTGLMVLSLALPISSILSSIFNYIERENSSFDVFSTIFTNYLNLAFSALAFVLFAKGADCLLRVTKPRAILPRFRFTEFLLVAVASGYTWLIVDSVSNSNNGNSIYHLPIWLVIPTLVIPFLVIWFIGAQTVFRLNKYQQNVQGIVYNRAMTNLVRGLAVIILLSIILQIIGTMKNQLIEMKLVPLLGIVYFLLMFYVIGYGLVAYAARQLKKIEEV